MIDQLRAIDDILLLNIILKSKSFGVYKYVLPEKPIWTSIREMAYHSPFSSEKGVCPMAEVREMMDYLEQYAKLDNDDILLYLVQKEKEENAEESDDEDQVQISEIQGKDA